MELIFRKLEIARVTAGIASKTNQETVFDLAIFLPNNKFDNEYIGRKNRALDLLRKVYMDRENQMQLRFGKTNG